MHRKTCSIGFDMLSWVLPCSRSLRIKTASNVCEIFVKLFHNFMFVCTAVTVPSEVINLSFTICFLFFDFNTSFIVFHVFLQSFLYNSNIFLKCIFFDCLIICVSLFL